MLGIVLGASCAVGPLVPPADAETIARLSVTVNPKKDVVRVPGPFFVDADRVFLHVPSSSGVFLLSGERIRHHFPLPDAADVLDLAASEEWLAVGVRPPDPYAVDLHIFELENGSLRQRVKSGNPFLRIEPDFAARWRVLVGSEGVGVFHPPAAATYPLWNADTGIVPSSEQVGRARAGLGFGRGDRWIVHPDGSVERGSRGRTDQVVPAGVGDFVGGRADGTAFVRVDGAESGTLPREIVLHAYRAGVAVGETRLPTVSRTVKVDRLESAGTPVRVVDDRIFWLYLGYDFIEVRAIPLPFRPSAGS